MRTISMLVISAIMFILHILLAPAIAIFTAKIDFIMISVIFLGIFAQKWYQPVLCAVYSGLCVDIVTQAGTYINTGLYLFFGILIGVAVMLFKENTFPLSILAVSIATALKHLIYVFLLYIMRLSESLTITTFFYGLPSVIYTVAVATGIYFVYKGLFSCSFMQEKTEDDGKFFI